MISKRAHPKLRQLRRMAIVNLCELRLCRFHIKPGKMSSVFFLSGLQLQLPHLRHMLNANLCDRRRPCHIGMSKRLHLQLAQLCRMVNADLCELCPCRFHMSKGLHLLRQPRLMVIADLYDLRLCRFPQRLYLTSQRLRRISLSLLRNVALTRGL